MKMRFLTLHCRHAIYTGYWCGTAWERMDCTFIMIRSIWGIVPGRPRYGEPDLSASGTAWYLPAYAPEKGKRRADLSSGLRHCGRIHHRRASVPLCDEGQVSSEKRDVPDAEEAK